MLFRATSIIFTLFCLLIVSQFQAQNGTKFTGFKPTPLSDISYLSYHIEKYTTANELSFYDSLKREDRNFIKKELDNRLDQKKKFFTSDNCILEGDLYKYVNSVFKRILKANPSLPQDALLVISRDTYFNALTFGDGVIVINLGLLYRLKNEEQLALIIGHELAHNTAKHAEKNLLAYLRKQKDESLNRAIKSASSKEFGRVTALNELLIPHIYASKENSRRAEFEADSLGLVYFRAAGYETKKSLKVFDIMENSAKERDSSIIDYKRLFSLDTSQVWNAKYAKYNRNSSLGIDLEEQEENPYLLSHPYEHLRLEALMRQANINEKDSILIEIDSNFLYYQYLAEGEMIHASLLNENLARAFFYSLKLMDRFKDDHYSKDVLAFVLADLSFQKKRRKAGSYIGNQRLWYDETYDRTVFFLTILSPEMSTAIGRTIWANWCDENHSSDAYKVAQIVLNYQDGNYNKYVVLKENNAELMQLPPFNKLMSDIEKDFLISGKSKKVTK